MKFVYHNTRPHLVIEAQGGASLGRCYAANYWQVTSRRRLSGDTLKNLYNIGVLGFGQEFMVKSQCDGHEEPAGHDTIPCTAEDDYGKVQPGPAINPYSGKPYAPITEPYYVYLCEARVDSGD